MSFKPCITCNICGNSYSSDCSCRYNRTPTNDFLPSTKVPFRTYKETIKYELELWDKELKLREKNLEIREKNLEIREKNLEIRNKENKTS